MPLAAADYRQLILTQTGTLGNAQMTAALELVWDLYSDKSGIPRLQYRYALRDAIDLLLGLAPADGSAPALLARDWQRAERSEKDSQYADRLLKLKEQCAEEITRLERIAAGNRGPAVGEITKTEPRDNTDPPVPVPADPGYPGYRGDPVAVSWPNSLTRRP